MNTRLCYRCKVEKDISLFTKNNRACRECHKELSKLHYLRNKSRYMDYQRNRRRIMAAWLREYKSKLKCMRCGESDPICIDMHHRNSLDKTDIVSKFVRSSNKERLLAELNKCDPLCANCHRKLHRDERLQMIVEDV